MIPGVYLHLRESSTIASKALHALTYESKLTTARKFGCDSKMVRRYLEERGYGGQFCPVADEFFYRREFNLHMNPRLAREELDTMIEGLRSAAKRLRK